MNIRRILNNTRNIDHLIRAKKRQQDDLINSALRAPVLNPDKVQNSVKNITEERNLKIAELGREIEQDIIELEEEKLKVSRRIKGLDDYLERAVLEYRYVNIMSWDDIEEEVGLTKPYLYKVHEKAIRSLIKAQKDSKR